MFTLTPMNIITNNQIGDGTARPVRSYPKGNSALVAAGCVRAPRGVYSVKELQQPMPTAAPHYTTNIAKRSTFAASTLLGSRIREARQQAGLTMVERGAMVHVGQSSLSLIENGHCGVRFRTLDAIAAATGTTVEALATAPCEDGGSYVI